MVANPRLTGTAAALGSALLFGVTTPLAKLLLDPASPLLVAGLLYLGSGAGLALWILVRERGRPPPVARADWPWLAAAVASGGVLAPALLMTGLSRASAASASLLLNLEAVFTALLAWVVFREHTSRRMVVGFAAILAGGVLLAWPDHSGRPLQSPTAMLLIAAACLCWGLDNNLTRKIAGGDARIIAALKGLAAGATNTALGLALGSRLPGPASLSTLLLLGLLGYGVSLVLYIRALRHLGTARTGAYFGTAPFIGGALALVLFGQGGGSDFWLASACMAFGVWLHLTEHHEHDHVHKPVSHSHEHVHDEHHRHDHDPGWDGTEPHTHEHRHLLLRHRHPHFPDIHHQHTH